LVAREMGLPVNTFLSANNINDIVPVYLQTGEFKPRPSVTTIANAMDVGNPSNFARILDIFDNQHDRVTEHLKGYSFTDNEIREIIKNVFKETKYVCDPHGATGYQAAKLFMSDHREFTGIFLETAHPAKFSETVRPLISHPCHIPPKLAEFSSREKQSIPLEKEYDGFKSYLLELA